MTGPLLGDIQGLPDSLEQVKGYNKTGSDVNSTAFSFSNWGGDRQLRTIESHPCRSQAMPLLGPAKATSDRRMGVAQSCMGTGGPMAAVPGAL